METDLATLAEAESVKVATKIVVEKLFNAFSQSSLRQDANEDVQARIARHLTRVLNWASTYTFLGLGAPKESDKDTIALRFSATPRRYRNKSAGKTEELTETSLLADARSTVVLGEPGAGKTTTLRRIALSMLTSSSASDSDGYQFPVVILLREMAHERFLCEEIADVFGLAFTKTIREGVRAPDSNGHHARADFDIRADGMQIEDAVANLLNSTNALVLIDGLDELPLSTRSSVDKEVEGLYSRLQSSSIIVSCRSGDFSASLHGFRVVEIAPLDHKEITEISRIWLPDPTAFLEALDETPYRDIVDRPLLLSFLLFLYGAEGKLPPQPSQIYRKVVYRLLKDWDDERRIARSSRYAHFDTDRKIDFLSELAYELTYDIQGKIFDEKTFRATYEKLHTAYSLPASDHAQVASEIQTHTGIVVTCGLDSFEFAHLSIQEYLAANFISRSPYPDLLKQYLAEYPAPVAVACALSSNPSAFFFEMINRHLADKFRNHEDTLHGETDELQLTLDLFGTNTAPMLKSFLSRLRIENPYFKTDKRLGESVLCLFAFYYRRYTKEIDALLVDFATRPSILDSVRLALRALGYLQPEALTRQTIVFDIDQWFIDTYERVADRWREESDRAKRLPFVLLPTKLFASVAPYATVKELSDHTRDRITLTLAASPFCANERGGHQFRDDHCQICGFIKGVTDKKLTRRFRR